MALSVAAIAWLLVFVSACTQAAVAHIDTVGWTDRDRQAFGPSPRYIVNDPVRGLHTVWKDGLGDIRYNFRPQGGSWRWNGGTVANRYPRNLGGMDVFFTTGRAVFGADYVTRGNVRGAYFRDSAPGAGRFAENGLGRGFRRILPATSRAGALRFAAQRNDSVYHLSFFSLRRLDRCGPLPTHSIAGSRRSARFSYLWSLPEGPDAGALMLKETPNGGASWFATINLSDTSGLTESRAPLGAQAVYDSMRLYVVTAFHDGRNPNRSRLWLYAGDDSSAWYLIHDYVIPDSVRIGDLALSAGRPSIGRSPQTGELFVVWEQFDPDNLEPRTGLSRADVWVARSRDQGRTWGAALRLTGPDAASRRFPFLADVVDDSLQILCFADQCAGFWEQRQGPKTRNPVLLISVAVSDVPVAVSEPAGADPTARLVAVAPSVSRRGFTVGFSGVRRVRAFDPAGRLRLEELLAGPVHDWGHELPPGVWILEFGPATGKADNRAERVRVVRLP